MSRTRRRFLAALGTAGTLGVAGCLDSSSDTTPTATGTPRSTTGSPEDSTAAPGTDTDTATAVELAYPEGFSEDGIASIDRIVSAHREYLLARSNYTERWVLETIDADGETDVGQPTELTVRANPADERVRFRYHDHANHVEVFYDGTYYEYDVTDEIVHEGESPRLFTDVEKAYRPLAFWAVDLLLPALLSIVEVEPTGSETAAGESAVTFAVTGVSDARKEEMEGVTYTGADGGLVVTESGGILEFDYTPQFESDSTSLQAGHNEITGVGETSVPRPDWLP